ncbi:MAG: amylo-alpha-1,6-glucosidase [Planctomycetota bacterium]
MDEHWTTHVLAARRAGPDSPGALDRGALLEREWLLTNGTGAYSMGTALGCNTRRYHGLFIAATHPPVGRVVALNQTIDQLVLQKPGTGGDDVDGPTQTVELSSALFPTDAGLTHAPRGHEHLTGFAKGLAARWAYVWGGVTVSRALVLHDREQAVTLRYTVEGLNEKHGEASLSIAPLLTLRDFHGLLRRDAPPSFDLAVEADDTRLTVERGPVAVTLSCPAGRFEVECDWWFDAAYPRETYRGQGDREDYFTPGRFMVPLDTAANEFTLTVALGEEPAEPIAGVPTKERVDGAAKRLPGDDRQRRVLAAAADDFVVGRTIRGEKLSTIIAGYPWFADWGRDTFIALPGLLLTTGRYGEARDVLKVFAGAIRHGLVPNRFDDYDDAVAHYNTVDASLWYVQAGLEYVKACGDRPGWLLEAMSEIVAAYIAGTEAEGHDGRPVPIGMDRDGLITAGDEHSQLTWMDAACGGEVFTPRPGKCVEINALWYNALVGLSELLETTDADADAAQHHTKLAAKVKRSFAKAFWSAEWDRLIDHVTPSGNTDPSLRSNMVFACSLPHSPLPATKRRLVLAAIRDHLLTPVGLRTLPPDDPAYHPRYGGPQFERDEAYHQGTVWPWLLGPYAEGVLRAGKFSKKSKTEAAAVLQPLLDRLTGEGLGQLHEIHDAELPHALRGCIAQAWSVAELVRVLGLIKSR